jgi:AP-1 complex subunit mu
VVQVAANGTVLRSEIVGSVQVRSYLSGMPELRLGLNDRVQFESNAQRSLKKGAIEMEDVNFHQCVRLSRFDSDRTISFIPPDKDFELVRCPLRLSRAELLLLTNLACPCSCVLCFCVLVEGRCPTVSTHRSSP